MESIVQPGRLLSRIVSLILSENELKLPSGSNDFKALRDLVKNNGSVIDDIVEGLFARFEKWDATTRHAALLVCDYFFHRSHQFRVKIIERIPELFELICESNPLRMPLPPPAAAARSLKTAAIKIIRVWHEKFQAGYPGLDFVNQFLFHSKSVDYEQATAAVEAERLAKEQKERKVAEQNAKRCEKAFAKIRNAKEDIERNITEVENALRILVPSFDEILGEEGPSQTSQNYRQGLVDGVTIVLKTGGPKIIINEDNEPVVEAVKDGHTILSGYLKLVTNALSALQKYGASQQQLTDAVDLKNRLAAVVTKAEELKLSRKKKSADGSDSEESDLEDVPEKKLEDFVTPYEVPKYIMKKIADDSREDEPCCSKATITEEDDVKPSTSQEAKIPILPFGLDLKYWGEDRGEVQMPRNNFDGHRFWRPPDEEEKTVGKVDSNFYETRTITYIGEELRPKRECRARLANGQLCPRRDKNKCPIHGVIAERDEEGFPVSEIVAEQLITTEKAPYDDDDELITDIELATGKNLSGKRKGKKHQRYEVHQGKVVRDRLEKKLLDKRTIRRVGETLDAIQKARIEKKHGHQFVHALHR